MDKYKYIAIGINPKTKEICAIVNEEKKPNCNINCNCNEEQQHGCLGDFTIWQSNHKYIEFASLADSDNVRRCALIDANDYYFGEKLKKGEAYQTKNIEIEKDLAYFKYFEEVPKIKQRLYTEEEMKQKDRQLKEAIETLEYIKNVETIMPIQWAKGYAKECLQRIEFINTKQESK